MATGEELVSRFTVLEKYGLLAVTDNKLSANFEVGGTGLGDSIDHFLAGLIDPLKERDRLAQRIAELTGELTRLETRLRDAQFTQKAPPDVVQQVKDRRSQVQDSLKKFSEYLAVLQTM